MVQVAFKPGGPNEVTVEMAVTSDTAIENNETFTLRLRLSNKAKKSGAQIGQWKQAQVTIVDDDSRLIISFSHIVCKCVLYSNEDYVLTN